ncbi:Uncharacterised protein [Salmonella enterica subsp. enterica serovar Bovismorbificans]|nr:Uncharacterised protein [Salmonella enterica subsp. enterica serovar Bovismorbificans]
MIPVRSLHNLITTHEREIFLFHLFPSHASVSTISISLTTFCQLNLFARKSPFWIKCLRSSESLINLEIPLVIASSERGSTRIAASPATSGNDEVREVNTGIPQAMPSTTGNPKPSYKEGKTNPNEPLYNDGKSFSDTNPKNFTRSLKPCCIISFSKSLQGLPVKTSFIDGSISALAKADITHFSFL